LLTRFQAFLFFMLAVVGAVHTAAVEALVEMVVAGMALETVRLQLQVLQIEAVALALPDIPHP